MHPLMPYTLIRGLFSFLPPLPPPSLPSWSLCLLRIDDKITRKCVVRNCVGATRAERHVTLYAPLKSDKVGEGGGGGDGYLSEIIPRQAVRPRTTIPLVLSSTPPLRLPIPPSSSSSSTTTTPSSRRNSMLLLGLLSPAVDQHQLPVLARRRRKRWIRVLEVHRPQVYDGVLSRASHKELVGQRCKALPHPSVRLEGSHVPHAGSKACGLNQIDLNQIRARSAFCHSVSPEACWKPDGRAQNLWHSFWGSIG